MGLAPVVEPAYRLPSLTTIRVPEGVDEALVRRNLLERYGIELGGGLGPLKGQAWRLGLMGESSTRRNVMTLLAALHSELAAQGQSPGDGCAAAQASYEETSA